MSKPIIFKVPGFNNLWLCTEKGFRNNPKLSRKYGYSGSTPTEAYKMWKYLDDRGYWLDPGD